MKEAQDQSKGAVSFPNPSLSWCLGFGIFAKRMAAPARILAANLGSQAISLAEFRPQGDGGLILRAISDAK